MWRDLWIVLVVVVMFFLCLSQFEMHDTKAFNCLLKEEKSRPTNPIFAPVEDNPPAYVARGSLACVEEVVAFANMKRAGPDGIIGTQDDALTVEEQMDLLGASLEANFVGGYWVYSPFFRSYEHYGSALLTQVLMADVDEMLLLRVAPAGSSFVINAGGNERHIFPLEGTLAVTRGGPLRPLLLRPMPSSSRLSASSPSELRALRVKSGRRLLVGVPEARGAVYLEHITAHVPRAAFTVFGFSSIVYGWDVQSAITSVSALYKSLHRNVVLPLTQLLWEGSEPVGGPGAAGETERPRRKAEQQALADASETREEEEFSEARRLMHKAQQEGKPPTPQTPQAEGAPTQEGENKQEQTHQQQQKPQQQEQQQTEAEEDDEDEEEEDIGHDEL